MIVLVAVLVLVFPLWDIYEARWLRTHESKIASYVRISAGLWATAAIAFAVTPRVPVPAGPIVHRLEFVPWIAIVAVVGIAVPVISAGLSDKQRDNLIRSSDRIAYLLPRSDPEFIAFAITIVSASIAEEIVYRGFLVRYVGLAVRPVAALAIAAVIFGIAHAGQGVVGVIATAMIGCILGWLFITSGGLLMPIILHFAIDARALVVAAIRRDVLHF